MNSWMVWRTTSAPVSSGATTSEMTTGEPGPELRQAGAAPQVALTWRHLYSLATERLGSDIEARRIVERASGREGPDWLLTLDESVQKRALSFFDEMVERRAAGGPLQYVLRRGGFRPLVLLVDLRGL